MKRVIVFFCFNILTLLSCFLISGVHAATKGFNLIVSDNYIPLTYKTSDFNTYSYNGRGKVTCISSNPIYVTCSVDSNKKRIIVTPLRKTNTDVTITVFASDKMVQVQNNASVKYDGDEGTVNLMQLSNPVVETSDIVEVPDTGSLINKLSIVIGVSLVCYGSYLTYRKLHLTDKR